MASDGCISYAYCPNVGIYASENANSLTLRSNLSILELLRPFCKINQNINIKNKENPNLSIDIKEFEVNLIDLNVTNVSPKFCATLVDEAVGHLQQIPERNKPLSDSYRDVTIAHSSYQTYVELISRMVVPDRSDYVHSLVGCILVSSTLDENILSTYNNLNANLDLMINSNQCQKNSYINFFERNIFKYYVLLHDQTLVKSEKLDSDVSALKNIFGPAFFVISFTAHSPSENTSDLETNPWYRQKLFIPSSLNDTYPLNGMNDYFNSPFYLYRCFSSPSFNLFNCSQKLEDELSITRKDCGKLLSFQDHDNIKQLMVHFFVSGLIPHLWNTLGDIQFVVNEKNPKKSVLVNAKSFFKGSILSKNTPPSTSTAIKLRAHPESWEILSKKLADLFFILKKFDYASNIYKSLYKALSNDKQIMKNLCWEMNCIISLINGQNAFQSYSSYNTLVRNYLAANMPDYALRASFPFCEYLSKQSYFIEAANILNENICTGGKLKMTILYDRMGSIYVSGGLFRKALFAFISAGAWYDQLGHIYHSLRCFQYARTFIKGKHWFITENYINENIVKKCFQLDYQLESALSVTHLVNTPTSNTILQTSYIHLFLEIMTKFSSSLSYCIYASHLPICLSNFQPCFYIDFISLILNDTHIDFSSRVINYFNETLTEIDAHPWGYYPCSCEVSSFDERLANIQTKIFPSLSHSLFETYPCHVGYPTIIKCTTAFVDEPFIVTVPLINKLSIHFRLKNIQLLWSFTASDGIVVNSSSLNAVDFANFSRIQCHFLEPFCCHQLTFELNIKAPGNFSITGIMYQLSTEEACESLSNCVCLFSQQKASESFDKIDFLVIQQNFDTSAKVKLFPDRIYHNFESQLTFNFSITPWPTCAFQAYIWACSYPDSTCLPISDSNFVTISEIKMKKRSSNQFEQKQLLGKLYSLTFNFKENIDNFDISFIINRIIHDIFTFEIIFIVFEVKAESNQIIPKINYGHFHFRSSLIFDMIHQFEKPKLNEIESFLQKKFLFPPLKLSIGPQIDSSSFSIVSLEFTHLSYQTISGMRIFKLNTPQSTPNIELIYGCVDNVSISQPKKIEFLKLSEENSDKYAIISKSFFKIWKESAISIVLFYKCSFDYFGAKFSKNGCVLINFDLPSLYYEPTLFDHINSNDLSIIPFPYPIKLELYFDRMSQNYTSVCHFLIGIAIWNYSNIEFSLKLEAKNFSAQNNNPVLFMGPIDYLLNIDRHQIPKTVQKFHVYVSDEENLNESLFLIEIKFSGQSQLYRIKPCADHSKIISD